MLKPIITKAIEEMNGLPDDLQQQVLECVEAIRQQHLETFGDAWMSSNPSLATSNPQPIGQLSTISTSMATPKRQETDS